MVNTLTPLQCIVIQGGRQVFTCKVARLPTEISVSTVLVLVGGSAAVARARCIFPDTVLN
jgi:hypothetical protein